MSINISLKIKKSNQLLEIIKLSNKLNIPIIFDTKDCIPTDIYEYEELNFTGYRNNYRKTIDMIIKLINKNKLTYLTKDVRKLIEK